MALLQNIKDVPYSIRQVKITAELSQSSVYISTALGDFWLSGRFANCVKETKFHTILQDGCFSYFFDLKTKQLKKQTGPLISGKIIEDGYLATFTLDMTASQILDAETLEVVSTDAFLVFLPSESLYIKKLKTSLFQITISEQTFYCQEYFFVTEGLLFRTLQNQWFINTQRLKTKPVIHRKFHETHTKFNMKLAAPFSTQFVGSKQGLRSFSTFNSAFAYCQNWPIDLIGISNLTLDIDQPFQETQFIKSIIPCQLFPSYSGNTHVVLKKPEQRIEATRKLLSMKLKVDILHSLPKYSFIFPAVFPILKKELMHSKTFSSFCQICGNLANEST